MAQVADCRTLFHRRPGDRVQLPQCVGIEVGLQSPLEHDASRDPAKNPLAGLGRVCHRIMISQWLRATRQPSVEFRVLALITVSTAGGIFSTVDSRVIERSVVCGVAGGRQSPRLNSPGDL
jgi:hypothetical protein